MTKPVILLFATLYFLLIATAPFCRVSAKVLTVTTYSTSNTCQTGSTNRVVTYTTGECVASTTTSIIYECNSTHTNIRTYSASVTCGGAFTDGAIQLDQCDEITSTSSWRYTCADASNNAARRISSSIVVVVVVAAVLGSLFL